jgi:hypothetical protein
MTIESYADGNVMVTGAENMKFLRLYVLRSGLAFEVQTGWRMSRGRSCYAITKAEYGFKGNKRRVLEQLDAFIDAMDEENN